MLSELSKLLSFCREAIIAEKNGKILYANNLARQLMPKNYEDMELSELLPSEIFDCSSDSYTCATVICGRPVEFFISVLEDFRLITLLPPEREDKEKCNILAAAGAEMKNSLAILRMSSVKLIQELEEMKAPEYDAYSAMHSHGYHSALRIADNMALMSSESKCLRKSVFDVAEMCEKLIDAVRFLTKDKGVEISLDAKQDKILFYGDPDKLSQVLLNLLSNSLKYTSAGGRILITLNTVTGRLMITVADTGCGIPQDILQSVFSRYKAPRNMTDARAGLGLGLSIVRQIAEAHGGSVLLESKIDIGTQVTVTLPVVEPESGHFRASTTSYKSMGDNELHTILTGLSDILGTDCYSSLYDD